MHHHKHRQHPHTIGDEPPKLPEKPRATANNRRRASYYRRPIVCGHPLPVNYRRQTRTPDRAPPITPPTTGNTTPRPPHAHRPYALATGSQGIYRCVCGCVVLWSGTFFGLRKKRQKKRHVRRGCWSSLWTSERMRVRQVKRMCDRCLLPPTVYSFELVAVSHCFSRHHCLNLYVVHAASLIR